MVLNVSSSTIPLGHSCSREEGNITMMDNKYFLNQDSSSWEAHRQTYVLEASIERLKLLPGELGLSLELVQPLGLVPHRGELQVAVTAVCLRDGQTDRRKESKRGREKTGRIWQTLSVWMQVNTQEGVGRKCNGEAICHRAGGSGGEEDEQNDI